MATLLHLMLFISSLYILLSAERSINSTTEFTDIKIRLSNVIAAMTGVYGIYISILGVAELHTVLVYCAFSMCILFDRRKSILKINSTRRCY